MSPVIAVRPAIEADVARILELLSQLFERDLTAEPARATALRRLLALEVAQLALDQTDDALEATANPIELETVSAAGRTWALSAQVQAHALALVTMFLAAVLAAAALAAFSPISAGAQTVPLGANLERFSYPAPVHWFAASSQGRPVRMAYLSCSAGTLARDLDLLGTAGYRIDAILPFDFFPQTHHVETLALAGLAH